MMHQPTSAEQLVMELSGRSVSEHTLFAEMRSQPVNHTALWIVLANLQAGISSGFVVWLARTIEKIEDRRIASLVAKQLNDELGNGDFAGIHSVLLQRFVHALERWRPARPSPSILQPGQQLRDAEDALFRADAFVMVGALMSSEIFANKMDRCLGDEIRRQDQIDLEALRWLTLHETLEANHAEDSFELARLIPESEPAASRAARGAIAQWDILWRFLDDVHEEVRRAGAYRT